MQRGLPFSRRFPSFDDWVAAQLSRSEYVQGIERRHARYPSASLRQLRRHPGSSQGPLSSVSKAPVYRLSAKYLDSREQARRSRSLTVLSRVRRGEGPLSRLAREERISPSTVRRATGAFRKRGDRWKATKMDRIERHMRSYEHGERIEVRINDSRTATLLSRYANAVGRYRETGDSSGLAEFQGKTYIDAEGREHGFEADPQALRDAFERSESDYGSFVEIYVEKGEVAEVS